MTSPSATVLRPRPMTRRDRLPVAADPSADGRALWLDAFRGFTMLWLVSRGFGFPRLKEFGWAAPVAAQFDHAAWAGMTAWDLVQPFFMFIVGAAMPFAFARRRAGGGTWVGGLPHVLKRVLLLLLLSHVVMIGSGAAFGWQLINVLGQIAFAYLIAYLVLDVLWPVQLAACGLLLAGHWAAHTFWPGVGPGGPWAKDVNYRAYLDRLVLGRSWSGGYATFNFVSSATATIAGIMAANLLRSDLRLGRKAAVLAGVGAALIVAGLALSPWVPVVKRIWTPSFALASVGLTLLALLAFYAVYDAWPRLPSTLLLAIGANSIFIYVANMLFGGQLRKVVESLASPALGWITGKLDVPKAPWTAFAVDWLALGVLAYVAVWLYRRKLIVKI